MKSYKHTKATQLLLDLFAETDQALSVTHIITMFELKMNRTTVYRVLDRLKEQGVLHSFTGKDGLKWYAKCVDNNEADHHSDHPHFQCEVCGMSKCLDVGFSIPNLPDYKITTTNILLTGRCNACKYDVRTNKEDIAK